MITKAMNKPKLICALPITLLPTLFCWRHVLVAIFIVFNLTGCDALDDGQLKQNSLIYCAEGSPEGFNPQTVTSETTIDTTAKHIYNGLVTLSPDGKQIKPALAKSWHITEDRKKITFYLRNDVHFHQTAYFTPTRKFTADDVLFSFNRILDKYHPFNYLLNDKYPFFQNIKFNELIADIEKIDDYTVRFTLTQPNSAFLANLSTDFSVILSEEYGQQLIMNHEQLMIDILPIGTGPYKYKEYRPGTLIRYYPHEKYWQGKPKLSQLLFDITPSNTGRLTKLFTNECDVIAYPIAYEKIQQSANLTLESVPSFNIGYLGFNTERPPFNQVRVRQAIAHAINKTAIIDAIYFGHADVATTLVPKNSWAYDKSVKDRNFDIATAKQMLTDAGYPNGFVMDIWALPIQRAYNPNALTMAKLIQADLISIGITVNIVSYEWSTFVRKLARGEHQSVLIGWSAEHNDPDNFFTPLLSCHAKDSGSNVALWCNEKFDTLLADSLLSDDKSARKQLYTQALHILREEVPLIPIAHSKRFQARSNAVNGDILHAIGSINFSTVSKQ